MIYRSYICLRREKVIYAKKEEGEEIKVRHDECKKFLCKPQAVIVCIA
jgi:ribosomal protein L25 (general stress protein Ctc)